MFRCQICGAVPPANTPAHRKVVETRRRKYPFGEKAHLFMKDGRPKKTDDPGGVGFEIVREIVACPGCAEKSSEVHSEGCGPPVRAVAATISDSKHSELEVRFITMGLSSGNRLLVVAHTETEESVRIISARTATTQERRRDESGT